MEKHYVKILGLDLGSNSIGWAIRDTEKNINEQIVKYGSKIFEEGIKLEKGIPASKTAERTDLRGMRRTYFRRKFRKYGVLKILLLNNYCPLTLEELNKWLRPEKHVKPVYPNSKDFRNWIRLDFNNDRTPDYSDIYELRYFAANSDKPLGKFEIGRILYSYAQRRGFLSNRKSQSEDDNESGPVKSEIAQYDTLIGNSTLGSIMHEQLSNNQKVRGIHFGRKQLIAEFEIICKKNNVDDNFKSAIGREIFFQRPLKSQKQNIGYCTLEHKKHRCPISHYQFEQFRMLQFINSIKIKTEKFDPGRQLNGEEKQLISPLFFRKSKANFNFKEIKEKINKKYKKELKQEFVFNYRDTSTVSGCPTIASVISVLGEDFWYSLKDENQKNSQDEKSIKENEAVKGEMSKETIWNALFFYDDSEKLAEWAKIKLNLDDSKAKDFAKIHLKDGYSSLSLKAIRNILPFLSQGLIFSHAVFLANCKEVIGEDRWNADKKEITEDLGDIINKKRSYLDLINITNSIIKEFITDDSILKTKISEDESEKLKSIINCKLDEIRNTENYSIADLFYYDIIKSVNKSINANHIGFISAIRTDDLIKQYFIDHYSCSEEDLNKLYHPSALEVFPAAVRDKNNKLMLPKPEIEAIKNPVFNRAMYELKRLINYLIDENQIDENTRIHVEFGRELNSINQRIAIETWQKRREADNLSYAKELKSLYLAETKSEIEPTLDDIVKFRLWKEQNKRCVYTGKEIGIADLYKKDVIEIEHTLPRSRTLDNSLSNKTVCFAYYNRHIKKNKIPFELPNYDKAAVINGVEYPPIIETVDIIYRSVLRALKEKHDKLKSQVSTAATKEQKDNVIRQREIIALDISYFKNKIYTFEMKELKEGFKPSQGTDISLINRYSALYLKTLFDRVVVFQSSMLSQFKKIWGVQAPESRKDRTNHVHHAIDAAVLTFIDRNAYNHLADYYKAEEKDDSYSAHIAGEPPFRDFALWTKSLKDNMLVKYSVKDYALKDTKRKYRKLGKIQYRPVYKTDENGIEITDDNNRKIPVFSTDANGNILLDKHNKPIIQYQKDSRGNRIPLYVKGEGIRLSMFKQTFYGAIQGDMETKYVIHKGLNSQSFPKIEDLNKIVDVKLRDSIIEQVTTKINNGVTYKDAIEQDFYQNDELNVPVKKVRCFVTTVTNPLIMKQHLMKSEKPSSEYKKNIYVVNDGNYLAVVYDKIVKNKPVRDSYIFSNFDIAELKKKRISKFDYLRQHLNGTEYEVFCTIKKGDLVLFYEKSIDEINWYDPRDLSKRLYQVTDIFGNSDKRVRFKYHLEARSDIKLKEDLQNQLNDKFEKTLVSGKSSYEYSKQYSRLHIGPAKFNFLVNKIHFNINEDGSIKQL